ncbi:MAG: hypothetical protein JZU65_14250 [Chlorobium sp.]|nr:hypothetical protein [Chlorobium sp.]
MKNLATSSRPGCSYSKLASALLNGYLLESHQVAFNLLTCMLFDCEKQAMARWTIAEHKVCDGCPYRGSVDGEPPFCIMRQNPPECFVARLSGREAVTGQDKPSGA